MMILVVNTFAPFRPDESDIQAAALAGATAQLGHEVDRVRIPFARDPEALIEQLLAIRLTEISDVGDLMIAVGSPAHLVRHHRKVLWFTQDQRSYGTWGAEPSAAANDEQERLRREAGIAADKIAIREARGVFASSPEACAQIQRLNGAAAVVLAPPPAATNHPEAWPALADVLTR